MGIAISIDVSDEIASQLIAIVQRSGQTVDSFVRNALITSIEDELDAQACDKILADPSEWEGAVSLEELQREAGI